jgi:hypothetical protein
MNTPRPINPLLHEYRRGTEPPEDDGRGWQRLQRRLFPPVAARPRRGRLLVGSLATALAAAWLLGASPRPGGRGLGDSSGAGGSEGTSGRAWGRGGQPGGGGV